MSIVLLLAVRALPIHARERGLELVGLYMRLFIRKGILPQASNAVHSLGSALARQQQPCGVRAIVEHVGIKA
jgi:hypothetical protein